VKKLSGFQRVTLQPGQSTTVSFTLDPSQLGYYDNSGHFTVEPGAFDVFVGDSSDATLHSQLVVH
jgi:beta-glucosidase